MHKISFSLVISFIIFIFSDSAQAENSHNIKVSDAYIRASIPGTVHSSAYMVINNKDEKEITLVNVTSQVSARIEMHNHLMENGMMSMQQLQKINIAPNSQVVLQPHGLHLMFFDLAKPLKTQDNIEITLHFSNNYRVIVPLPVKSLK